MKASSGDNADGDSYSDGDGDGVSYCDDDHDDDHDTYGDGDSDSNSNSNTNGRNNGDGCIDDNTNGTYRWANVLELFCIRFIKYNSTRSICSLVGVVIDQG